MSSLSFLGIAQKAGRVVAGEEQVLSAINSKKARIVILASDAGESVCKHTGSVAESCGVFSVRIPNGKLELGSVIGRGVCAVAAITDIGFAHSYLEKLAEERPDEDFSIPLAVLRKKAARIGKRKRDSK